MKYFTRDKSSPVKETSKKQLLQRTASSGPEKHREPFSMWLRKRTVIISLQDEPELIPQIWREEQNWSSPNSIQNAECSVPFAYGRTTSLFMPESVREPKYIFIHKILATILFQLWPEKVGFCLPVCFWEANIESDAIFFSFLLLKEYSSIISATWKPNPWSPEVADATCSFFTSAL